MTRREAVARLLKMHNAHQIRLQNLSTQLCEQVAKSVSATVGGSPPEGPWPALETAATLARRLPVGARRNLLASLPVELAEQLEREIYSFEAIANLPPRTIQSILRACASRDIAVALIGASESIEDAVLDNVSARAATMIREDRESAVASGDLSRGDVDDARGRISDQVRLIARNEEELPE